MCPYGRRGRYTLRDCPLQRNPAAGDNVYLTPAEPGVPSYIGRLHSLHEDAQGMWATVKWYYRWVMPGAGPHKSYEEAGGKWAMAWPKHHLEQLQAQ